MPILRCQCGGLNYMGLHVEGCSGEALSVVLSSLKLDRLQTGIVDSGDALCCKIVCPRSFGITLYL